MKILMLLPYLPNPSTSGGQTRWYNIIKHLTKEHEITLFSLIKDDSEKSFIPELEKYCNKVFVFNRPKKPWTVRNILLSVFGPFPLLVIRNWSFEERRAITKELASEKYDLIHAETFYVMPHLSKTKIPTIQVEQTIWHEVYKHHVMNEVPMILRPFYLFDVLKLRFWEKHYWKKADQLVAVSSEDRKAMQKLIPGINVEIIPNGVDIDYYTAKKVERKTPPRVLYGVSNFEWLQNQEAVELIVKKVWPLITKENKNAKLWIVGRKMPTWLIKTAKEREDIQITQNIADPRDAYRKASIMVAPIKGSGGTRLKILEAMAAGLPVVSTDIGVAGLGIKNGVHAYVANTNENLAKQTVKLLENSKLAEKIGKQGQRFVEENYDWKKVVKLHDGIYAKALQKGD
ncbi:glycosyltransferase family 4 protein [Patescibacteria group bacterium]|nr:glycosyltransferase family 4 protein [Patescibacteria group bacterium]